MGMEPKIQKDFNLTGEQLELMELLRKEAEEIPMPLALDPNMMKQRLPSKQRTPVWKVLSPIMAAAAACFAVVVVGQQGFLSENQPGISLVPPMAVELPQLPTPTVPSDSSENRSETLAGEVESSDSTERRQEKKTPTAGTISTPGSEGGTISNPVIDVEPVQPPTSESVAPSESQPYGEIYAKIKELNGKNPAQVKGVARAANFSALFGNNPLLMSARQTDTGCQTDIAQFDGKYIYSISEDLNTGRQSVVISPIGGETHQLATELFVDFGMTDAAFEDIRLLNCYVDQGRLTVVGSASYQPETPSNSTGAVTAVATYDLSDPEHPLLISNSYQDGNLLSSRVSGGFLYLVTRKTVSSPNEENLQSYLPMQMSAGESRPLAVDDIYMSRYAESPCYIVLSSILLKEPERFYDTMAILGDSSELYLSDSNVYLADYIYKDGNTYTAIVKSSFGKGNFEFAGQTDILGRLFDSETMDEYQGALRVVTTCGAENILYTLDQQLDEMAVIPDIAEGERIQTVQFGGEKLYYVTLNEPDRAFVIDLSDPLQPTEPKKLRLSGSRVMPMVAFGEGQRVNLEVLQGEMSGLSLSLYDVLSPSRIVAMTTDLVASGDVYSESIDNPQALLAIPEQGLIGFSYMKYDGAKGESGCYYALYQLSDEGTVKKVEYQYPGKVYNQRGFEKDRVLYVTSSASLLAFNIDNGKLLWEVAF